MPNECTCGYLGTSRSDLDAHLIQMMHVNDEEHYPKDMRP